VPVSAIACNVLKNSKISTKARLGIQEQAIQTNVHFRIRTVKNNACLEAMNEQMAALGM
jgi:hypothetical protein